MEPFIARWLTRISRLSCRQSYFSLCLLSADVGPLRIRRFKKDYTETCAAMNV